MRRAGSWAPRHRFKIEKPISYCEYNTAPYGCQSFCYLRLRIQNRLSKIDAMPPPTPVSAAIRERNMGSVLEALRARRPASRADIADMTGLSKPTVGGALRSFESAGLVREYGRITGRRGPAASLYDLVPDAALVLGIDIGSHHVRALVSDLDGETVEELTLELARPDAAAVLESAREIARRVAPM